jgi:hypothetical protein
MEKIDGEWKIAQLPKAPGWLYQYEGVLTKVILANHKKLTICPAYKVIKKHYTLHFL